MVSGKLKFVPKIDENLKDFQSYITHNFGPIYDTKLLFKELRSLTPKNDKCFRSSLSEIYSYLKDKDKDDKMYSNMMCIELTGDIVQDMQFHHARWDAYCTGYCFLKIIHNIKMLSSKMQRVDQKFTFIKLLKSVEYYKNKLYTYRSISNSIYLEGDDNQNTINFLIIQNKGFFYKPLDIKKLKFDLKQFCDFDLKLLSNYTALVAPSYLNNHIICNIKSNYHVEDYSHYQSRKKEQYLIGLIIITTVITIQFLRK